MKKKTMMKRVLSGILSAVSLLSAVASPLTAYAAETQEPMAYGAEYPELDEVKAQLADGEVVTANDLEVAYGSSFDVENDFEGIEQDAEKVKVTFHEAKNSGGQDFSTHHADTYQAVYYVEPVSGNPAYRVSRTITVKEPQTEKHVEGTSSSGQDGDDGSEEGGDSDDDAPPLQAVALELMAETEPESETETTPGQAAGAESQEISSEAVDTEGTELEPETNLVTETETAQETEEPQEPEPDTEEATEESGLVAQNSLETEGSGLNVNRSYVSGLAVKSLVDGTAPFDGDDEAGNDSSSGNHIVRTFDYVNYTLEYTTALMDTSATVDEAYMMVEFVLDCDPSQAEFNGDTLNWCVDRSVTYYYSDGSASAGWDSSRPVERQVLSGKRYLSKNGDSNAIPGVGTLSVGIYVKAAQNGDVVRPSFTVWMEGNEERLYQSILGDGVTVSAAPRYNIKLAKTNSCDYLAYFDTESGKVGTSDMEGSTYGRLEGYSLTVQLYNTSADKGLKGVELPAGDITFDLTVTETLNGEDVTGTENYAPILWDYRENMLGSLDTVGSLGRQMSVGGKVTSSYGTWSAPWNSGGAGNREYGCYDGGTFTISQDSEKSNVYHVAVKGYAFDIEDYDFPTNNCGNTAGTISYGANVGCFSAGYVQFVCQFARSVDTTSNLYFTVAVDNLHATSVSGQETTSDQRSADDKSGMNVTLYPKGTISKRNFFYTSTGAQIASVWLYGDSYANQGQKLRISSVLDYAGDNYLTSANILQKFDDKAIRISAGTSSYVSMSKTNSQTVIGSVNVLFAAKPDKTGWTGEAEMNAAREEQLVYFDSIDALTAAGYTCVGYLYEIRDSQIYQGSGDSVAVVFQMMVEVTEDAQIGTVYQTTNDVRAWHDAPDVISWSDVPYGGVGYGLGDSGWAQGSYAEGYLKPGYTLYTNYGKSVYQDGSIVAGHSGGYIYGNSVLIIGCKTGVSIQVADETATAGGTARKSVYDLDAGERTAAYVIHPSVSVVSANSEVETSGATTDVTVKAVLPKGLTYIMNSASLAPVDVAENEDGTSTVTWYVEGQQVGADMEDITFSCIIGEAGTANDVRNNDTLTIAATITSDKDQRSINKSHGNYSDTTISVIRLATSSVSKAVDRSLVEEGDKITYFLRYGNSAEEDVAYVRLFDVLPYNGDGRGTDFSGAYVIDSITVDYSNASDTYAESKECLRIFTTTDTSARNEGTAEAIFNQKAGLRWTQLSGGTADGTGVAFSGLSLPNVTGLYFDLGTVKGQEYLNIQVTLAVRDDSGKLLADGSGKTQQPGNTYSNSFYQYAERQVAVVESNTVSAQVVERTISGCAWLDENSDGIRDGSEKLLPGVPAALYRTAASGFDPTSKAAITVNGARLYTAYDVLGNEVEKVKTGKDGSYCFTNLEAGTYYVVFTGLDGYGLTVQDAGEDDTRDSDAMATVTEDGSGLENAFISGIMLPKLDEMYAYSFGSSYNDAGFLTFASGLTIQKTEEDTETALPGAVFVMQDADGKYLTFDDGDYTGSRNKVNEDCYLTTGEDGTVAVQELPLGSYILSEYQAPLGYQRNTETWTVAVKASADHGWTSYVTVDGEKLETALAVKDQPAMTTVAVTKAWRDNGNQDNLRSDVVLHLTGTVVSKGGKEETVVSKSGVIRKNAATQSYTFTGLPAYAYGKPVTYSVTEESMDGYATEYSVMDGDWKDGYAIVVTNTHEPQATEYTVSKVWDDDGNRDGIRPESIEVKLIGSDGTERVAKIAEDDGWKYTFSGLPVYQNEGTAIKYSLVESPVSGYARKVSGADADHGFTVTNTHAIETVDIPVEKVWDDADDQDGLRMDNITVVLTGSDGSVREAQLTADGGWEYTFAGLPCYWNEGAVITYSLQEKEVDGYTDEVVADADGYGFTVTNNHIPAVTDVLVMKEWDDADNQDGIRPESVSVTLTGSDGKSYEAQLTAENGYSCLFAGLPVYFNHGTKVAYSLTEAAVEGYESAVKTDGTGYRFMLSNTHEPETMSIPVTKVWDDNDDQDGIRPEKIAATLTGDNGLERRMELTAENGWEGLFAGIPVYHKEGTPVKYTLSEDSMDGYTVSITGDGTGFTVRNTHVAETTEVKAEKLWDDDGNRDGIRPEAIHITLTGSDGRTYETDMTGKTGWTAVFTNLPVYFNHGERIAYSIAEEQLDGYEVSIKDGGDGYSFTLTNTHEAETTEIPVVKIWDDNDDQDGIRPERIAVTLLGSDGGEYQAELTAGNGWTYRFENVPVYWMEGTPVEYTLAESAVDGYSSVAALNEDGTGFVLTNTHVPETTEVCISKIWDDDGNRDGIRPESIHVVLTGSDGSIHEADLTESGSWKAVIADLPVYSNHGERIFYTVTEGSIDQYESTVEISEDGYAFALTNAHEIETTEISVVKAWDDGENQDGVRPDGIEVVLTGSDGNRYMATLDADHGWAYTFTGLPVYWNEGDVIDYSLTEMAVDGYSDEVEKGEDGYHFTVTNNHIPAVADVVVRKVWDDGDDQDGIRPDSIRVVLAGSDGSTYEADLTEENGFVYVFTGLPVYFHEGETVVYSLREDEVAKYESQVETSEDGYTFTLTNRYTPLVREITVTKVWDDQADKDGLRRDVALTLTGSDGSVYQGTISKDAVEQAYTFAGLPVYAHGEKITYMLAEAAMDGYTVQIAETEEGFTVTNTHTPKADVPGNPTTVVPGKTPKTGDDSPLAVYLGMMVAALLGMALCLAAWMKRKKN